MTPALAPDAIDLLGAAGELGMHYDTLRKNWRRWSNPADADFVSFPLPFRYPAPGKRGVVFWRRSAIADWKLARERALGAGGLEPPTRGHRTAIGGAADHAARRDPQLQRERAELAQLMERA